MEREIKYAYSFKSCFMSLWAWGITGDGQWGGREAGVSITKFSLRALLFLLIGCIDLAQEMIVACHRKVAAGVVCGIVFAQE